MRHVAVSCITVLLSTLRCEAIVSRKATSASWALSDTTQAKDGHEAGNKPKQKHVHSAHHAASAEASTMRNKGARSAQKPALVAAAKESDETIESANADEKDEISGAAEGEDRASRAKTSADMESHDSISEPDVRPKNEGALADHTLRIKHNSGAAKAHRVASQRSSSIDDGDAGGEQNEKSPQVSDGRDPSLVGYRSAWHSALHAGHGASTGDAKSRITDESGDDSAGKTDTSSGSQNHVASAAQQAAMSAIMAEISQAGATESGNSMDTSRETQLDAEGDASVLQQERVARHDALAENLGGRDADAIRDDSIDTMGTSRASRGARSIDSRSRLRDEALDGTASADEGDRIATRPQRPDMDEVGEGVDVQQVVGNEAQDDAANAVGGVNEQSQEEAADAYGGPIDQVTAIPRARTPARRTHRRASFARVGARYRAQRRAAHQFHMGRRGEDSFENGAERSALDDDSEDEDDDGAQATLRTRHGEDEGEASDSDGSDSDTEERQGEASAVALDASQGLDDAETYEAPLGEDTVATGEDDNGADQASLLATSAEEEGDVLAASDVLGGSDDEGAASEDLVGDRVRDSDSVEDESASDSSFDLSGNGY